MSDLKRLRDEFDALVKEELSGEPPKKKRKVAKKCRAPRAKTPLQLFRQRTVARRKVLKRELRGIERDLRQLRCPKKKEEEV
jgi:hypothetical protein